MLSISWRTIFISNVALVILYGIAEYREQKRLKEEEYRRLMSEL